MLPFYQAVTEKCGGATDCRKHLAAFIKATEMLEIICINMFLQPWKKEIRSLKTFTGPYVYCLLPVLSRPTIQSVLASIGYLPSSDDSQSEFKLSADVDTERALLLGFELLLAKVECYHLLDLLMEHHLKPQEWLDVLQREKRPTKLVCPTEKQMVPAERKDNVEKKNELDQKEEPLYFVTRPAHDHINSVDQSVMELQKTYPDLAFRGRPLLQDQPHKSHLVTDDIGDGTAAFSKTHLTKENKAFSPVVFSGDNRCNDQNTAGVTAPSDTSKNLDESRPDANHLSGPQAISLHITLRTGAKAKSNIRIRPTNESSDDTHQKSSRGSLMADKLESPKLSSVDEEQLRALAERMGQVYVQGDQENVKSKNDREDKHEKQKQCTKL